MENALEQNTKIDNFRRSLRRYWYVAGGAALGYLALYFFTNFISGGNIDQGAAIAVAYLIPTILGGIILLFLAPLYLFFRGAYLFFMLLVRFRSSSQKIGDLVQILGIGLILYLFYYYVGIVVLGAGVLTKLI